MKQRGIFEKVPGSGSWWVRYVDVQGRLRREKAGRKKAAEDLYRKRKTQALEGRKLPEKLRQPSVLFDEIARDALTYSGAHKVSAAYKGDCWTMGIILGWFRGRVAADIAPQEIEGRLSGLAENGRAPATLNRYRALLSLTYSLANRNGKLSANPARLVRLKRENNARIRFLDEPDEASIRIKIRQLYPDREPEFDLALNTGMRRGEQYRLRWENVNQRMGIITIPRSKHGERRYIPINSTAQAALEILAGGANGSPYVCRGSAGERAKDPRRWFEESVREAKISDLHWHDLRHTFASRLVMAGVDLRTVQELMGHKAIAMTVRYAHLAPAHQREAIERLVQNRTDTRTDTTQIQRPQRVSAIAN